jgi:integrase
VEFTGLTVTYYVNQAGRLAYSLKATGIRSPGRGRGVLFCWEDGRPPHPDTITRRFKLLAAAAGPPEIDLHDVRHSYATAGRDAKIDWKALSQRIGHADVAFTMKHYVQTDLEADRQVANTPAELIIGGSLVSMDVGAGEGAA